MPTARAPARASVVGAVSWKPIVLDLEQLAGQRPTADMLRTAVQPVRSLAAADAGRARLAAYKREMAVEFAARALISAWQRAGQQASRHGDSYARPHRRQIHDQSDECVIGYTLRAPPLPRTRRASRWFIRWRSTAASAPSSPRN